MGYELRVVAVDRAGNREVEEGPEAYVTMETTPPDLAFTAPAWGTVVHRSDPTVARRATDALSAVDRYEMSVEGGPK